MERSFNKGYDDVAELDKHPAAKSNRDQFLEDVESSRTSGNLAENFRNEWNDAFDKTTAHAKSQGADWRDFDYRLSDAIDRLKEQGVSAQDILNALKTLGD